MVEMNNEDNEIEPSDSDESNNEILKEEQSLQFHLYIIIFFINIID